MKKRILSILLTLVLLLAVIPLSATATTIEEECVYLSISFDGEYINDQNGKPIVYLPVALDDIKAIDLTEYGLDNMLYDADGDGEYETTALQLLIYAHEELYGGDWGDVNFDALPGSSYFKGGIFGFTENLMYFHNGDFPVDESQSSDWMTVGATSDRIVLEAGDFLDVASFECFSFLWDQLGGFHFFADENENLLHDFTTNAGETLSVKLMHSFCDLMFGEAYIYGAADYEVYYGKTYGVPEGTLTTDGDGNFDITIDEAGTYYLWCYGANGSEDGTHISCDHYCETGEPCIVSAPGFAKIVVVGGASETPREPQDVSGVLNATLLQLSNTVTEPSFGTNAGEWTVFSLARGEFFDKNNVYFTDYYNRIVDTVNKTASSVNKNGALDKNKSTENSRLIVALSAIGKDATSVGDWNLVEAYSANGINWIKKQGMNGTIWALIALDSNNYATSDPTIRQQCVDAIVSAQHDDGGWSLVTAKAQPSNVDITCMALTALYPYRNQPEVAEVCAEAIEWLSSVQLATGGFPYGSNGETSESCAWAIVALTAWGINPDTDPRFIKNGNSVLDNLLSYYVEADRMFAHQGTESNAMATDQASYALVAYNRFIKGKTALYDYSDVDFQDKDAVVIGKPKASLGLPAQITDDIGGTFNATVSLDQWDNDAGYKLIDLVLNVPEGLNVTNVTAGNRLCGGEISFNFDSDSNKLRVVYFDANNHNTITTNGNSYPVLVFNVTFGIEAVNVGDKVQISIEEMSIKNSSDSADADSEIKVETTASSGKVEVVKGISYSAVCLYTGDDVDLIPSTKKAVAVSVVGKDNVAKLTYNDSANSYEFKYSTEISEKVGIDTYIALVDASIDMTEFTKNSNFTFVDSAASEITFGDYNSDGVINAQDALAAVDTWLRKTDAPTDDEILALNVNGDSRINTFDALGIVEAFVNDSEYAIVIKASTLMTKN